jgi:hypothetical protein
VRVNFLASEQHYVDHLLPVYAALPDDVRGEFVYGKVAPSGGLTVVSSFGDYKSATGPTVYFEHGAGFMYHTKHPAYAGGPGKDGVVLFCSTNERVAEANRLSYPDAKHVVVGCPKLDAWVQRPERVKPDVPVAAFSFHWDSRTCPETRWAFPHYQHELRRLASARKHWSMLGHGHPMAWGKLKRFWDSCRVPTEGKFVDVTRLADVYVADSTSTLYEFAVLDRPVVVLNAPWYRRNVHHGVRFWELIPGEQVDHPRGLAPAVNRALTEDPYRDERRRVVAEMYPFVGDSCRRAAEAICGLL